MPALRVSSLVLLLVTSSLSAGAIVESTVVLGMNENSYLLIEPISREAALIDVGGPIEPLLTIIRDRRLTIRYVLVTHAHPDHVAGIPAVIELFPHAKLCMSRAELEDTELYARWEAALDPEEVAAIKRAPPVMAQLMSFNLCNVAAPDALLEDGQVLPLGSTEIRVMMTPGHARGHVVLAADNVLFTGDLLFYRKVGRTDLPGGGGWDKLVESVRRVYSSFPDATIVYPGHGRPTDIGSEKRQNTRVRAVDVTPPM